MRDQRYLVHYPSLGRDIGLLAAVVLPICGILAAMVTSGDVGWWIVGTLDLAFLGPFAVLLARDMRVKMRLGRHRTIRFSIDLEGVYDGETSTFLPWSRVTAVKFVMDEAPPVIMVTGCGPDDWVLDDRWAPAAVPGSDLVVFSHVVVAQRPVVESAVRAFAPSRIPIEHVSRTAMWRLLAEVRQARSSAS